MEANILHVHLGLALFLSLSLLFRSSSHRWVWSLFAVAVLEAGNEALDVLDAINGLAAPNWRNGLADIADTLFWPIALTVLSKARAL